MTGQVLYVRNLPSSVTEQDLSLKFAKCGTVLSATIITDRDTGRSKGCGLIEMASEAEAQTAIQRFNFANYDGRVMAVYHAPLSVTD
jgi:RNA recognition motif-containing protein